MQLPVNHLLYRILASLGLPVVWEVSVGAVLFRERQPGQRQYLLLEYPSGHFDFAKGHVEPGETEEETLRREVVEETGFTALTIMSHRMSIRYFYVAKGNEAEKRKVQGRGTWIFKQVHFYPAQVMSDTDVTISHEHTGAVWLSYAEAVARATFDNAKNLIVQTEALLRQSV